MYRFKKTGEVPAKCASEIERSRLGIGFEKLDRDVFDPEKAYLPLSRIGQASLEKNTPIFAYCLRGTRSKQAVSALVRMGYTQARSIGGITGYKGKLER